MKKLFLVVMIFYSTCLFGLDVQGTIESDVTWTAANSPYNFTGDVYVQSSTLTIDENVVVNLNGNNLYVTYKYIGDGVYETYPGKLNATNVEFNSSASSQSTLIFDGHKYDGTIYHADGTLTNCTFVNVKIDIQKYSKPSLISCALTGANATAAITAQNGSFPTIQQCTISNYTFPMSIISGSQPVLVNNNFTGCLNEKILLSGDFTQRLYINQEYIELSDNYTLPNNGYTYVLLDDINIKGVKFTIASGNVLELDGNSIFVNYILYSQENELFTSQLLADDVSFVGDGDLLSTIEFEGYRLDDINYWTYGTLNNCDFDKVQIKSSWYSSPNITNSTFVSNLDGVAISCEHGGQPVILGNSFSSYLYPIGVYSHGNPTIQTGNTFDCINNSIAVSGDFKPVYSYKNNTHAFPSVYTFTNYDIPYQLDGDLNLSGKNISIPTSTEFNLNSHNLNILPFIGDVDYAGAVDINKSAFTNLNALGTINIYGVVDSDNPVMVNVDIDSSSFENISFHCYHTSEPRFTNNSFDSEFYGSAIVTHYGSSPVIDNNTFNGYDLAFGIEGFGTPELSNNDIDNCQYQGMGISGEFKQQYYDYDLNTYYIMSDSFYVESFGYPYYLSNDMTVKGCTVTFAPGLQVNLNGNNIIINYDYLDASTCVSGILYANQVKFANTDEQFSSIELDGTEYLGVGYYSQCYIEECTLENINFNVQSYAEPHIINNTLHANSGTAATLKFGSGITLQNNIIYGFENGVTIANECDPLIEYNDFIEFSGLAINNTSNSAIDAFNNYWGDPSGPSHSSNPEGAGVSISDNVNFDPYSNRAINTLLPAVVINEIMYNPVESPRDSTQFIELYNSDTVAVDLQGWTITNSVEFEFTEETIIEPNGYLVIADHPQSIQDFYGPVDNIHRWESASFADNQGTITIYNADGFLVDHVFFDAADLWPAKANGLGPSMELEDYNIDNNSASNWSASNEIFNPYGTPGKLNSACTVQNHPPQIFSTPDTSAYNGHLYTYQIDARDIENDTLYYELVTNGDFLEIDPETGFLSGTPQDLPYGRITNVTIRVSDDSSTWVEQYIPLTIDIYTTNMVVNELYMRTDDLTSYYFIELYNNDSRGCNLKNWQLTSKGTFIIDYSFTLNPGEFVTISNDTSAVRSIYHNIDHMVQLDESFELDSTLVLKNDKGHLTDSIHVDYLINSFPDADVNLSLELANPSLDNSIKYGWTANQILLGTPGFVNTVYQDTTNYPPFTPGIIKATEDTVDFNNSVTLKWNKAVDLDNDDVEYTIWFASFGSLSRDTLITGITDTSYTLLLDDGVTNEQSGIQWSLKTSDSIYEIQYPDTVHFFVDFATGIDKDETVPLTFDLLQNYPNPFNPVTTIQYNLAKNTNVNLTIYNIQGQIVKTLIDNTQAAGTYQINWDATNQFGSKVSSGLYFYKLTTSSFTKTKKMIVLD